MRIAGLFTALVAAALVLPANGAAEVAAFSSGDTRVTLVELYTSEGCSSCPPADRWLSRLASDDGLWREFVPIAFHVDYWDYIGWTDRFAQPAFGDRQRRYVAEGGARFVYTPGMFINGSASHDWRRNDSVAASPERVGQLVLKIENNRVFASFDPVAHHDARLTLNIAIVGMNIDTRVRAGENRGKTLHHDFVALAVEAVALEAEAGVHVATVPLPGVPAEHADMAVVAWVSAGSAQAPLQAVGGYLDSR